MSVISSELSTGYASVNGLRVPPLRGVPASHMGVIRQLARVWSAKYPRNLLRSEYYAAKNRLKDFGIGIPNRISAQASAMIGWPELAVRSLSDLSSFQGFNTGSRDELGVLEIFNRNSLDQVVAEAIVSAYIHSCSFLTISVDENGQPVIRPASAEWSAGIWDYANHRLAAALTIMSTTERGDVTRFCAWLPGVTYDCEKTKMGWSVTGLPTGLDEPAAVAMVHDKQLQRPFGHSRISRPVMAATDIGFRTVMRMEGNAEFYASPRLWFLGLAQDAFDTDTWSALQSAVNSVSKDIDGDVPTIEQVAQASMAPHVEMLKSMAMLCAASMRVPVDYMGITLDNPTSAESQAAAERRLTRIADRQNVAFGRALVHALMIAVHVRDGRSPGEQALEKVTAIWAPTREESGAARADSFAKVAAVIPGYADSDVGLEKLGLSQEEIRRLRIDQQRVRAQETLNQIRASMGQAAPEGEESSLTRPAGSQDPVTLKAKFDALGVAIRAGVSPESAATSLGLDGVEFTGAVPVSLRMPESEATD
ncbi:MAG: phage portal protein [Finegoldia magna]|nr:phage portal protein [Finegoldia magna]MBS5942877.1 phage portal protein [Finegoldia magna]